MKVLILCLIYSFLCFAKNKPFSKETIWSPNQQYKASVTLYEDKYGAIVYSVLVVEKKIDKKWSIFYTKRNVGDYFYYFIVNNEGVALTISRVYLSAFVDKSVVLYRPTFMGQSSTTVFKGGYIRRKLDFERFPDIKGVFFTDISVKGNGFIINTEAGKFVLYLSQCGCSESYKFFPK